MREKEICWIQPFLLGAWKIPSVRVWDLPPSNTHSFFHRSVRMDQSSSATAPLKPMSELAVTCFVAKERLCPLGETFACRQVCPGLCLYFRRGGLGERYFWVVYCLLPGHLNLSTNVLLSSCTLKAVMLFRSLAKEENCILKNLMVPFCSPEFCWINPVILHKRY